MAYRNGGSADRRRGLPWRRQPWKAVRAEVFTRCRTPRLPLFLVTLMIVFTSPTVGPLTLIAAMAGWMVVEGTEEL